jgi:hypothetical protein
MVAPTCRPGWRGGLRSVEGKGYAWRGVWDVFAPNAAPVMDFHVFVLGKSTSNVSPMARNDPPAT